MSWEVEPFEDPRDPRVARGAAGVLHDFNASGVLEAADVHVAQRLGRLGQEADESVLLAVALTVRAVRSGSVCLDLGTAPDIAPGAAWPEATSWAEAVARSPLVASDVVRVDDGLVYLDRYWGEEQQVVADLAARSAAPPPPPADAVLADALAAYFPDDAYADQRAAAAKAATHGTSVITGGPGTGKTSTVARLLGVLLRAHAASDDSGRPLRIALAAPTGKAAARMVQAVRESTGQRGFPREDDADRAAVATIAALQASTLHRLLGWTPNSTRFRHHRGNRLPYDVVVVDETSMLSLTMMARLVEAVRPSARLVLVGDADQLASVDAGAVLKDLVDGYGGATPVGSTEALEAVEAPGPVAQLSHTRRFGERIGALALAIRDGDVDTVLAELRAGSAEVAWLGAGDSGGDELLRLLADRAVALHEAAGSGDAERALVELERHRLLCAHREGPFGVARWNRTVERLLLEATGRDWLPEWYLGRPFVVNANDYGLRLWNGDTGVVCRTGPDLVAVIGDGDRTDGRALPTSRLAEVSTAHAMTVHRSQGSQFDEVTVVLPEEDSRILTRELLYTAVTRAKSRVRVVGSEDAVRAAVTRRAQRATGLARHLRPG
ncbi:exodeoxyribonuclease V subunit alpha [Nocardioides sp. HDW12B]|uniref:exodeoxyribonuclease V subunit alpha n=1 Tax=Nocardioides sp. HDW12B TaxID=2714939 RepID=UPI00140E0091|nr:exodeoxyribonuclease V subunit alpha [Nocardioides sp. HDW12B]